MKTTPEVDKLLHDFRTLSEDLVACGKALGAQAEKAIKESDLAQQAKDASAKTADALKVASAKAEEAVKDKPLHAVGLAALAGLAVGVLLSRK